MDAVIGLAVDEVEGALAMTERGCKIVKIWSSAGAGPYESNGSGTVCNMGSMTGSELSK